MAFSRAFAAIISVVALSSGVCNKMERRPSAFTPTLKSLAVWLGMSLRKLIARETAKAHLCDCTYFFPRFTPSPAGYWFSFALNQYPERIGLSRQSRKFLI